MFDIGWSEMAVIALIALIVIGPKELPNAMRGAAKWVRKARSLAREFQSGIDDMVREADLEDARKAFDATRDLDVGKIVEDTVDPTGDVREEAQTLEQSAQDAGDAETWTETVSVPGSEEEPDSAGGAATSETAEDQADAGDSTVVSQPANIAPPHSLTPPPEDQPDVAGDAVVEETATTESDVSRERARTP